MPAGDIVIEMTPFIYEDGETYYFNITRRQYSNEYHDIWVYEKVEVDESNWFRKKTRVEYQRMNKSAELVSTKLDVADIKRDIKKIIQAQKAHIQIKGWDGIVGNVPKDVEREAKLNQIL